MSEFFVRKKRRFPVFLNLMDSWPNCYFWK